MIKTLIVDDEERSRNSLHKMLENYCPDISVVGKTGSAEQAKLMVRQLKPDILFLDIQMPGENGIELMRSLGPGSPAVIFITAYSSYAMEAIKLSAFDYILKPVDVDELVQTVEKFKLRQLSNKSMDEDSLVSEKSTNKKQVLTIPTQEGLEFIDLDELVRCSALKNYTLFYLRSGKKIISSKNMGEYENALQQHDLFRVHHSHIVNIREIRKYIKGRGGCVLMSDGEAIEVAQRRKTEFFSFLEERLGRNVESIID